MTNRDLLVELARVRVIFQMRALAAVMGLPAVEQLRDLDDDEGLCDCCGEPWEMCKHFFENWICGMGPDGQCSLAGTEECDWECPRR